jgi:L-serine deaminase
MDALKPNPGLLCKIVSVLVHADEMRESINNPAAHEVDRIALASALDDPEVKEWVETMTQMSMAPIKRSRPMANPQPFNRPPARKK